MIISRIFDTAFLVSGRVVTVFVRSLRRRSCRLRADSGGALSFTMLVRLTFCRLIGGLVVGYVGTLGGCSGTLGGTVSLGGRICLKKMLDRRSSATAVEFVHSVKGALGEGFFSASIRRWAASVASYAVVIWGIFVLSGKKLPIV